MQYVPRLSASQDSNILRCAAFGYVRRYANRITDHIGLVPVAEQLADLTEDHQHRLDEDLPTSPIPLLWLAMAQAVGLTVDITTGRITGGPEVQP